jgi:hypothetical protein
MPTAVEIIRTNAVGMHPRRPRPPYFFGASHFIAARALALTA